MAINPLGTLPLMTDGDVTMTESAAICEYLAQRFSPGAMNVRPDEAVFGAYPNLFAKSKA